MNPLGARDSPHPEIVELLTEETSRDTRPSTTEHRNPALGVPRFMRETAATMNRSRMDESHENSAPEQPSRATAPTSQTKETLERRASGLPRAHGKNNLFDRDVRIPGRYPSLGHTDSVQQPLDISDDSDDELPTTITTRKKGVAFIDHRADLSSPLGIRYPLMSEQRRYSRQSQAEVDTDYFSEAWLSPGPAASLEPLVEHAYERAQFERQPSTSYVIPREDNVTTFDLWENDAQGNPQRKDSLHTTPIGHTNNDQSKALNRLYDQIRDMWRDLGNERKHSDQLGEQLLARDKVIENLHSKDQETQDILEGYKGDVADTQAVLKNCQDQLQSSVATVARLTEELRDARGSAHEDYQQAQNQAENLAARKSAYKDKYRQEHDAHRATLENMKKLQAKLKQATAKVSRSARRGHTGPSPQTHRTLKATMPTVLYQPSLAKVSAALSLRKIDTPMTKSTITVATPAQRNLNLRHSPVMAPLPPTILSGRWTSPIGLLIIPTSSPQKPRSLATSARRPRTRLSDASSMGTSNLELSSRTVTRLGLSLTLSISR
ncbi:hypothetical protein PtrM4_143860 [Pyrenophora tritici-repentis]|uniref:Uncharacterized protein n=1 Tax=Pyrenophora tritici-repentis TaxID=45151 RepID=A0A834RL21_9PLEO|nr:hypothetical protein PtrM4_143860 [Pyrenophora tritici-repentis]